MVGERVLTREKNTADYADLRNDPESWEHYEEWDLTSDLDASRVRFL